MRIPACAYILPLLRRCSAPSYGVAPEPRAISPERIVPRGIEETVQRGKCQGQLTTGETTDLRDTYPELGEQLLAHDQTRLLEAENSLIPSVTLRTIGRQRGNVPKLGFTKRRLASSSSTRDRQNTTDPEDIYQVPGSEEPLNQTSNPNPLSFSAHPSDSNVLFIPTGDDTAPLRILEPQSELGGRANGAIPGQVLGQYTSPAVAEKLFNLPQGHYVLLYHPPSAPEASTSGESRPKNLTQEDLSLPDLSQTNPSPADSSLPNLSLPNTPQSEVPQPIATTKHKPTTRRCTHAYRWEVLSDDYVVHHIAAPAAESVNTKNVPVKTVDCILGLGDKGEAVATLQYSLQVCEGRKVRIDGVYGQNTEAAVADLQSVMGVEAPDGVYSVAMLEEMLWVAENRSRGVQCLFGKGLKKVKFKKGLPPDGITADPVL